ncbi:DUF6188 family protein [Nocardia cyriacigeorgica]|uniref:Uncharacterized protein n=2 Tax=Nocardia TaxID=1817 RepID=H6QY40_NOCCG|nr:DUF6188 family protein [Nocardia cyriacigeorgica]CCF61488.1 conserved protein of unknown function [Nocardia cyriacigeorgica GUH-2]
MRTPVSGMRVSCVTIGYTVTAWLGESFEYELQIECDLEIADGSQPANQVEYERYQEHREQIQTLVGAVVETATIDSSGSLELGLDTGVSVRVLPDMEYEAWSLVGPRGYRVVCLPGGQLAIWSAR